MGFSQFFATRKKRERRKKIDDNNNTQDEQRNVYEFSVRNLVFRQWECSLRTLAPEIALYSSLMLRMKRYFLLLLLLLFDDVKLKNHKFNFYFFSSGKPTKR